MTKRTTICKSCASGNLKELGAEISVHFGGFEGLNKFPLFIFPMLQVCLDCGFTEFMFPEAELDTLGEGAESHRISR
jgi:hypothetical protein